MQGVKKVTQNIIIISFTRFYHSFLTRGQIRTLKAFLYSKRFRINYMPTGALHILMSSIVRGQLKISSKNKDPLS